MDYLCHEIKTDRKRIMKKIVLCLMMMLAGLSYVSAQAKADIKFDKTTHDFGTMPVDTGAVACTFTFTNVGDAPLVIHQAWASCGCTVPEYTQEPVLPGKTGTINVTYKGNGLSGHFQKSVTVYTNGKTDTVRLYVKGDMVRTKDK